MTTSTERQSTPLSLSGCSEDAEPVTKKSRKRKAASKPIAHSSTLRGLWGYPKPPDVSTEETTREIPSEVEGDESVGTVHQPIVFKITPSKLARAIESAKEPNRMITPPPSLPEVVPETPVQQNTTPKSRKRSFDGNPVRRSPRNHRSSLDAGQAPVHKPVEKKTHPFFMGKEARKALQATAQPAPPAFDLTDSEEPSHKRQKSSTGDNISELSSSFPAKSNQPSKALHPFFMSRTASMESTGSMATPLLPLPQGKTVYLGNAPPAPFPSHGMNHIYDKQSEIQPPQPHLLPKQHKGKWTYYNYQIDVHAYESLAKYTPSITFIPPERAIMSKSEIEAESLRLVSQHNHQSLLRAHEILTHEDKTQDPDGHLWINKFRPRTALEILCSSSSGIDFREWMAGNRKLILPTSEMDDFIVDDDDESIISEDSPRKARGKRWTSYSNVVILVGEHGVGKSAAVEAVAEELGYQVFEISPGSKRGYKEVMEGVGEVGQSELVTKHKGIRSAPALFPGESTEEVKERKGLICFEEVDVLYEEDKGFWNCVTSLVERSRRPVILTCNGISFGYGTNSDLNCIPENFQNCKVIEFHPAESDIVRDYLRIITLSQGHLVEPALLEKTYLEMKRDLRRTIMEVQFWCQFGIGDNRCGAEWINWGGRKEDWVMSRGSIVEEVRWRQELAVGEDLVLQTVEEEVPDVDLERMLFPLEFQNLHPHPSPSRLASLKVFERWLDTMSFLDYSTDQQFTAYEVLPVIPPSTDDVLSENVLRIHPGRHFEEPQIGEARYSPPIRILAEKMLEEELVGYRIPPLTHQKIVDQPLEDYLHPRMYIHSVSSNISHWSAEEIRDLLDEVLYEVLADGRFQTTLGTVQSLETIIVEVAPQIRNILKNEHQRRRKPEQLSLDTMWSSKRVTRGQIKEEQEGKKRYFDNRVDVESVLKTGLQVIETNGHMEEMHLE